MRTVAAGTCLAFKDRAKMPRMTTTLCPITNVAGFVA